MKIINLKILTFTLICLFFSSNMSSIAYSLEDDSLNKGKCEKNVYITFDDGPAGKITTNILDVLKQENVPATFFVIGSQIKGQEKLILRMKNEGHSIGLHSFSHDRNKLYKENEGFISEMLKTQDILFNVTGEKYNVLRFPFGCNNNSYKLTQSLVDLIHENNLKIYDWNTDSCDGLNPHSSPDCIARKSCSNKPQDCVVILMHCSYINKNSLVALPSIIKHYRDNGYTFKAITEDVPEIYKIMK